MCRIHVSTFDGWVRSGALPKPISGTDRVVSEESVRTATSAAVGADQKDESQSKTDQQEKIPTRSISMEMILRPMATKAIQVAVVVFLFGFLIINFDFGRIIFGCGIWR